MISNELEEVQTTHDHGYDVDCDCGAVVWLPLWWLTLINLSVLCV